MVSTLLAMSSTLLAMAFNLQRLWQELGLDQE